MNEYPGKDRPSADEQTETIELFGKRIDASTPCADEDIKTRQAVDRIGRAVDAASERARRKEPECSDEPKCGDR